MSSFPLPARVGSEPSSHLLIETRRREAMQIFEGMRVKQISTGKFDPVPQDR